MMDVKEFVEFGYLQELNRQFLHPLGLALAVTVDDDDNHQLAGIQDHRDDPEGVAFASVDFDKYLNVSREQFNRSQPRLKALGYLVQSPLEPT